MAGRTLLPRAQKNLAKGCLAHSVKSWPKRSASRSAARTRGDVFRRSVMSWSSALRSRPGSNVNLVQSASYPEPITGRVLTAGCPQGANSRTTSRLTLLPSQEIYISHLLPISRMSRHSCVFQMSRWKRATHRGPPWIQKRPVRSFRGQANASTDTNAVS